MRSMTIAAVAMAAIASASLMQARADTFCDQLKALDAAGLETPRLGSVTGETKTSGFFAITTTQGRLIPEGMKECTIENAIGGAQKIYKCSNGGGLAADAVLPAFDKVKAGIEACYAVKGEKLDKPDTNLFTYKIGGSDPRTLEVSSFRDRVYLTYYAKAG